MLFGLPINGLDNFEAEMAPEHWNGFPVPLVAHDVAVQIAEAVGDPLPEPYDGVRPYDGLCWQAWELEIEETEDDPSDACSASTGHDFIYTGTNYGGDDPRFHGEGRCYCRHCGADGDA